MTQEIATELLRSGLLGAICLAEALVIVKLWNQVNELHATWKAEMKETTRQLLAVYEKMSETVDKVHDLGEWAAQNKRPAE
jgi:hypothetical protein